MAFVNEKIPPADFEKYHIKEKNFKWRTACRHWTIDRERDIYFRRLRNDREDDAPLMYCELYWKGLSWEFNVWTEGGGVFKGPCWRHYSKLRLSPPAELEAQRAEIIEVLKEALIEFKEAGNFSLSTTYTATFDF